jgi:hypothetical protein
MPREDLGRLEEQKRATAEELRRIARTLSRRTDRDRVIRRAAELEAEANWLVLDAAAAVAALLTQSVQRGEEKGKSLN